MNNIDTVLIADDDEKYRTSLVMLLKNSFPNISFLEASNGLEVMKMTRKGAVDILILDLDMPIMDGYLVLRDLYRRVKRPKIIINSNLLSLLMTISCLKEKHSEGYFLKMDNIADISKGIQIVVDGGVYICEKLQQKIKDRKPDDILLMTNLSRLPAIPNLSKVKLTLLENEVMQLMCQFITAKNIGEIISKSKQEVVEIQRVVTKKVGRIRLNDLILNTVKQGRFPEMAGKQTQKKETV